MIRPHHILAPCLSLALAALALAPSAALAARHALLVGVAKYDDPENNLTFPEKDAALFKQYLIDHHGFEESEIRMLLSAQATGEAVHDQFAAMVERVQSGDVFVFFFSGHGSWTPDEDGDEPDGVDEYLCLHDVRTGGIITDDALRTYLGKLKTDRTLVLLDCCHSGTGTRGGAIPAKDGIKMIPSPFHAGPPQSVRGSVGAAMKSVVRSDNGMKHVLIAGCAADEVSYEHPVIGGGLVTHAFVNQVVGEKLDRPIGSAGSAVQSQVVSWVQKNLPTYKMQNVQVEGNLQGTFRELLAKEAPKIEVVAPPAMDPAAAGAREVMLTVAADKKSYRVGERMKVTVQADRDCHLRLYYTDHEGVSYLIFPNKFQQQDRIKGGQAVTLGEENGQFAFELTFPEKYEGKEVGEILTAVASPTPFTDSIGTWGESQFIELGQDQRGSFATRGVQVRQRPGFAVASYLISK